jgi:hypothetical protein
MTQPVVPAPHHRGGLKLPRAGLGVGKSSVQTANAKWRTAEAIESEFMQRGFTPVEQPQFECPQITSEMLTGANAEAYTNTFVQVNAWLSYVTDILARITARIRELDNLKKILAANSRKENRAASGVSGKRPTVQEQEDSLILSPEYQEVLLELQRLEQAQGLYKARSEMLDSSWRVISRQVEIRRQEIEGQRNSANGPNGRPGWSR